MTGIGVFLLQINQLGGRDQQVSLSVGKNTGIVLMPCHPWKYVSSIKYGGVGIPEVSGCHLL